MKSRDTSGDVSLETFSSEKDVCHDAAKDRVNRAVDSNEITSIRSPDNSISTASNVKERSSNDNFEMLPIYPIGTLRSIYRLCVGTPRQVSY